MSGRHPTPWRAEGRENGRRGRLRREFWAVLDRNEFFVAEGLDERTAREIVDAANERDSWRRGYIKARTERNAFLLERDRLRDLVGRLAQRIQFARLADPNPGGEDPLLREAAAALREEVRT